MQNLMRYLISILQLHYDVYIHVRVGLHFGAPLFTVKAERHSLGQLQPDRLIQCKGAVYVRIC